MNLTLEQRTKIFDKVCGLVETKHFNPAMNGVDWKTLAESRRGQILARLRLRPTSHANLQPNKSLARRLRCTQSPATCGTMNPRTPRHSASRNPGAGPTRQPPPLAT